MPQSDGGPAFPKDHDLPGHNPVYPCDICGEDHPYGQEVAGYGVCSEQCAEDALRLARPDA